MSSLNQSNNRIPTAPSAKILKRGGGIIAVSQVWCEDPVPIVNINNI